MRRRMEEEDDDHAATVLMKDLRDRVAEDALTPRIAPERDADPGRLIVPEPDIEPAPLAASRAPTARVPPPMPSTPRPSAAQYEAWGDTLHAAPPPLTSFEHFAWLLAAGTTVVAVLLGVWAFL